MVDEAGVLVGEAVVVLPPDVGGQQVVQRRDLSPPGEAQCHLEPLGMLIEHGIDDVDERLVAVEHPMPTGQEIAFQPALALVLRKHFHHASLGREKFIVGIGLRIPLAISGLKHRAQAVGERFVGAEDAEVPLVCVHLDHIPQEAAQHPPCPRHRPRRARAP